MKVLIVATNHTDASAIEEIQAGRHHRIDYIELANHFRSRYVDYNVLAEHKPLHRLEELLRLDWRQALYVARLVSQGNYHVVFSLSERVAIPLAHLLNRRVKHVVHLHHPFSSKTHLFKILGTFKRWDRVIVLTRATAERVPGWLGIDAHKIIMLPSPIDTRFYRSSASCHTPAQDHVLSLGLSHRDYATLIQAMRRLPHIPCHLRVGSTWLTNTARHLKQPLPPNIHLQPFVPPAILRECYAACRFVIVPIRRTRLWSAGCTTVAQAQAMGKPVIATRNPGMSDYVLEGETGILVEQSDPASMAEAIARLWNDSDLCTRMGGRAREWAATRFSLDAWLANVASLIETFSN